MPVVGGAVAFETRIGALDRMSFAAVEWRELWFKCATNVFVASVCVVVVVGATTASGCV